MFKLFLFCLVIAVASAGVIHGGAISTINTNLASYGSVPVAVVGHGVGLGGGLVHGGLVGGGLVSGGLVSSGLVGVGGLDHGVGIGLGHGVGIGLGGHGW